VITSLDPIFFQPTDDLRPLIGSNPRGVMNAPQAVVLCSADPESALGDKTPSGMFMRQLIGWIVMPLVPKNDEPTRRISPTVKDLVVQDEHDLGTERERLLGLIDRFAAAGPGARTRHPHSFFRRLSPEQWAI